METLNKKRRTYGEHLTPIQIFKEFILPEIKDEKQTHFNDCCIKEEGGMMKWIIYQINFEIQGNLIKPFMGSGVVGFNLQPKRAIFVNLKNFWGFT